MYNVKVDGEKMSFKSEAAFKKWWDDTNYKIARKDVLYRRGLGVKGRKMLRMVNEAQAHLSAALDERHEKTLFRMAELGMPLERMKEAAEEMLHTVQNRYAWLKSA